MKWLKNFISQLNVDSCVVHIRFCEEKEEKLYSDREHWAYTTVLRCIRMGKQHGTTSHFLLLRLAPPRWIESLLRLFRAWSSKAS